jgi:hypothetical protein
MNSLCLRTVFLWQLADNGRIGGVDGLDELVISDGCGSSGVMQCEEF